MDKSVISLSSNEKVKKENNIKMNNVKNLAFIIYFTDYFLFSVAYTFAYIFNELTWVIGTARVD